MSVKEKEPDRRGRGCCLFLLLSFGLWIALVIGPCFPRKPQPPFELSVVGSQKGVTWFATGERRDLFVQLQDRYARRLDTRLSVRLRSSAPSMLRVDGEHTLIALRAGQVTLEIEASLSSSSRKKWRHKEIIWISPWRLRAQVSLGLSAAKGKHNRIESAFFPSLEGGGSTLLFRVCAGEERSSCGRDWRGWSRGKKSARLSRFALAGKERVSFVVCCSVGSEVYFYGGSGGRRGGGLSSLQLSTGKWRRHPAPHIQQHHATSLRAGETLFLFGGSNLFTDRGGEWIQRYHLRERRWLATGRLPDRSWDEDVAVFARGKIFLLNRKGRLWETTPALKRWRLRASLPLPFAKRKLAGVAKGARIHLAVAAGKLFALWSQSGTRLIKTWVYDIEKNQWQLGPYLPDALEGGVSFVGEGRRLWLVGSLQRAPGKLSLLSWDVPEERRPGVTNRPTSLPTSVPTSLPTSVPTSQKTRVR